MARKTLCDACERPDARFCGSQRGERDARRALEARRRGGLPRRDAHAVERDERDARRARGREDTRALLGTARERIARECEVRERGQRRARAAPARPAGRRAAPRAAEDVLELAPCVDAVLNDGESRRACKLLDARERAERVPAEQHGARREREARGERVERRDAAPREEEAPAREAVRRARSGDGKCNEAERWRREERRWRRRARERRRRRVERRERRRRRGGGGRCGCSGCRVRVRAPRRRELSKRKVYKDWYFGLGRRTGVGENAR
jgi:hypothetical protein